MACLLVVLVLLQRRDLLELVRAELLHVPSKTSISLCRAQGARVGKGHGGRLWFRKGASAPDAPYLLDLLDLILLRQARVIRAALEHGLLELPPLLSPEVLLAGSLVAPANSILAEIESGELCGRREPVPLAAGGVRVLAAHIGTRAARALARAPPP